MSRAKVLKTIANDFGLSERQLRDLWRAAKRGDPGASKRLVELSQAYPKAEALFRSFASERARRILAANGGYPNPVPKAKPLGAWEKARAKASSWVSVVGGGLPSLGKRR
jgi:hypothetical protein